jgi:type I restriction enzyme S subunit
MNLTDQKYIDQNTYEIWSARCTPEPGDILVTREAPMGEVCLIPPGEKICLGQRMMLARLVPDTVDHNFMIYSLRDPKLMDRVQDKPIGATVQHLRVGGVETLLVPLPPLAEQHRIVAKVNNLMALCDRLEASLDATVTTRRSLLDALLAEALAPGEVLVPQKPERVAAHG